MGMLTVRDAADRLGVGYSTLKRWIRTGVVRTSLTEGKHHRIAESEVDRLISRRQPTSRKKATPQGAGGLAELSARNRLPGYVEEVRIDGLLAQVRLRVGEYSITAVVTADAVRALRLKRGDEAIAVIKSTEVMIGTKAG